MQMPASWRRREPLVPVHSFSGQKTICHTSIQNGHPRPLTRGHVNVRSDFERRSCAAAIDSLRSTAIMFPARRQINTRPRRKTHIILSLLRPRGAAARSPAGWMRARASVGGGRPSTRAAGRWLASGAECSCVRPYEPPALGDDAIRAKIYMKYEVVRGRPAASGDTASRTRQQRHGAVRVPTRAGRHKPQPGPTGSGTQAGVAHYGRPAGLIMVILLLAARVVIIVVVIIVRPGHLRAARAGPI
jgi:hypothetical protein